MTSSSATCESRSERFWFQLAPIVVLATVGIAGAFRPGWSASFAGWPLVLSLFVVGMPHGAVDFRVNSRLHGVSSYTDQLLAFLTYVVVLGAALVFLIGYPTIALLVFLITSGVHFGLADKRCLERWSTHSESKLLGWITVLARGGLLSAFPFYVSTAASLAVFTEIVEIVGKQPASLNTASVESVAGIITAVALSAQLMLLPVRLVQDNWRVALVDLIETSAIVLAFSTLHPLFAVGLYVIAWHSWRHMQPLMQFFGDGDSTPGARRMSLSIARLHAYALPLLVPTLVVFFVLAWWRLEVWSSSSLAALTIAMFAVVTLPHHLLVEQLFDRIRRRVALEQQLDLKGPGVGSASDSVLASVVH